MKKKTKVFLSLALAVILLFSLLTPALASAAVADDYIEWRWYGDNTIVGDAVYDEITLPVGYYVEIPVAYHYYNNVANSPKPLYTNYSGRNLLVVTDKSYFTRYFVRQDVKNEVNSFFDITSVKAKASKFLVTSDGVQFYPFGDTLSKLDSFHQTTAVDVDVIELRDCPQMLIRAYDRTECIYAVVGCLFLSNDSYIYVDYTMLPNNCFDASGNLSLRGGTVKATYMSYSGNRALEIDKALSYQNVFEMDYETYYEDDWVTDKESQQATKEEGISIEGAGMIVFFAIVAVIGVAMPIIPLILGLLLPRSKKLQKPRGWYVVAASSAVWLLSAVALMVTVAIILLVCTLR